MRAFLFSLFVLFFFSGCGGDDLNKSDECECYSIGKIYKHDRSSAFYPAGFKRTYFDFRLNQDKSVDIWSVEYNNGEFIETRTFEKATTYKLLECNKVEFAKSELEDDFFSFNLSQSLAVSILRADDRGYFILNCIDYTSSTREVSKFTLYYYSNDIFFGGDDFERF